MDSPVIVDTTSQFGRGIDLDREFPGFPFDDVEGFGRRGNDVRSHLDDLASRHPELADHLLGSVWGEAPTIINTGSLRNRPRRRRGSGSCSSQQANPEEDARSRTSASSASSAASGASGVNSRHGDSSNVVFPKDGKPDNWSGEYENRQEARRNPLPQYGLRNTVDIGQQQRHEMDNDERCNDNRGQRSVSAPPENRQQTDDESQRQNPNQRFVSRVDITPQLVKDPSTNDKRTDQQQRSRVAGQRASNVRHIPIFVEGRDEPVIPKNLDTDPRTDDDTRSSSWNYSKPHRTESPDNFPRDNCQFANPPQFHRPSHFNQHYGGGRARDWLPNFHEEFYSPSSGNFSHQPGFGKQASPFASETLPRHFRQPQTAEARTCQGQRNDNYFDQRSQEKPFASASSSSSHPPSSPPPTAPPGQSSQRSEAAPPSQPRKQTQPKDALEKVADVQREVDSLNEQVLQWNGNSRKDKQYMYLDEMLTRELIKLDDIETEGKENVRQARKNTIRSIQDSISLLESKAPLSDQAPRAEGQTSMEIQPETEEPASAVSAETTAECLLENDEKMDRVERKEEEKEDATSPASLPAASALPINDQAELVGSERADVEMEKTETENETRFSDNRADVATEPPTAAGAEASSTGETRVEANPEVEERASLPETEPPPVCQSSSMEVDSTSDPASAGTKKREKKTKKQAQQRRQPAPISGDAIPLPAPESHDNRVPN